MSASIGNNIAKLRERIGAAATNAGRAADSITLLAVAKTKPAAAIREAWAAGVVNIGENYLQEALEKQPGLADLPLVWHFIGPVQSNKTRAIAEHFHWLHSLDRLKIAQRLNEQRPAALAPINVCLQVNIDDEASKSGVAAGELDALADAVAALPRLRLRGLMAIPQATDQRDAQRRSFCAVRECFQRLQQRHPQLDTLSMGMSADLEAAIAEGSTLVRIGSDIFGARS